jgi:predicted phage baseplate assembly protein
VAPVHPSDIVLFERQGNLEARRVTATIERQRTLFATLTSTLKSGTTVIGTLDSPPIKVAISRLSLDSAITWASSDADKITVHHPLGAAARVLVPEKDTLEDGDPISVPGLIDPPRTTVTRLLLDDVHQEGVSSAGSLNSTTKTAQLAQGQSWGKVLTAAVTLYGNVLAVSRGETVQEEILGFGDGSQARQVFKLSKKPLTYLSAANANGYATTLKVRVGGVLWREVESFYGATDRDRVYIVRHDDQGEGFVHFGGGARLPSGVVVTATYRFGAGAAAPPAGSITQLARPVPGIGSVRNLLPAFGGGDAESPREVAIYAPRSALLLGRAISLPDLEVAAATVTGVQAARAMWRWDDAGLRAVAQIQYIGSEQLIEKIRAKLRSLTEPDAPITVVRSLPQASHLALGIEILAAYTAKDVIAAVRDALYHKPDLPGTGGLLRAERLGPEGVVFLSEIAAAVMGVEGVSGMQSATFDWIPFVQSGKKPLPGKYFDFGEPGTSTSRLLINGVA